MYGRGNLSDLPVHGLPDCRCDEAERVISTTDFVASIENIEPTMGYGGYLSQLPTTTITEHKKAVIIRVKCMVAVHTTSGLGGYMLALGCKRERYDLGE